MDQSIAAFDWGAKVVKSTRWEGVLMSGQSTNYHLGSRIEGD